MTGLSQGEQASKSRSRQAVRMLGVGLQAEQVDDVDETDLQVGKLLPQHCRRRQRLLRRDVAAARHHHVGLAVLVGARPVPDADALGAVDDRLLHVEILQVLLLVGDDDVDVVLAAQAVVGDRKQRVHVRRQIDPRDVRALVHDDIQEAGVLMREAVVVLPPDGGGDQQVERGDLGPPGEMRCRSSATWRAG